MRRIALLLLVLSAPLATMAQQMATIHGQVLDSLGRPVELMNVAAIGEPYGTYTDAQGRYRLDIPANVQHQVVFSHLNYYQKKYAVTLLPGSDRELNVRLTSKLNELDAAEIIDERFRGTTMQRIDPRMALEIPTSGGGIEALLKTLPGVSSNNEMSSQYNVRGGNYDENLVYVNDVEIYRPFLVRSGQQEGLSFVNPDMVESLRFSAGGFEARYGDKMSSVLDVTYRRPDKFTATVMGSLLGASVHAEGASKNKKFTAIGGFRYRSNRYVLSSLDTDGQYFPVFMDGQALLSYDISEKLNLSVLGYYSSNKYRFVPVNRETDFGTISEALRFTVYFDGQEVNTFETGTGALIATYKARKDLTLKFISSYFRSNESETFDVQGQYWLGVLDNDLGSDNLGEVAYNRGIGTFLNHGRNYLNIDVWNASHRGKWIHPKHVLEWGAKYQIENAHDRLSEWNMVDSAGYTIPQNASTNEIILKETLRTEINLFSHRIDGYVQNNFLFSDTSRHNLNVGARFNWWSVNNQLVGGPRATYSYKPDWKKADMLFRLSGGMYWQPPFYRELRNLNGELNRDIKAQLSVHAVLGADYNFWAWGRPFKLVAEAYYKYLDNIIPYEIDNVRIRYYATNNARGYATGLDLRVNGEFVKGIESWASVSVMTVQEDLKDDFYYDYYNAAGEKIVNGVTVDNVAADSVKREPGYIPRPTDQRVNFALYFQDYVPKVPQLKVHLNLVFGTGMPFGPPSYNRYQDTLRIPPYRRVDIGFSYMLKGEKRKLGPKNPFRHFKSIWLSAEVFNLLGINNTLSYLWIADITGRQYAVPNYLTTRQLNVKLVIKI
jgi:hypothetical protein